MVHTFQCGCSRYRGTADSPDWRSRLVGGDVGKLGGLLAAICFLVSPSALQWYGQNHKDAFSIVGLLLVPVAWLAIYDDQYFVEAEGTIRVFFAALPGAVLLETGGVEALINKLVCLGGEIFVAPACWLAWAVICFDLSSGSLAF